MYDLLDTTFIIPVKIDCKERIENLWMILYFLTHQFDTHIIVSEQGTVAKEVCKPFSSVEYCEFQCDLPLIHRTKQLNEMLCMVKTPYVSNYDCDVLFPTHQYIKALDLLRTNQADVVWPFDKFNLTVPRRMMNPILQKGLEVCHDSDLGKTSPHLVAKGGCIFFKTEIYKAGGGENEYFVAYGPEDKEREYRFSTLGYRLVRVEGNLYHVDHPRTPGSRECHHYSNNNWKMWHYISSLNKQELEGFIQTWKWYEKLNGRTSLSEQELEEFTKKWETYEKLNGRIP